MRRLLVTGGAGFIGCNFVRFWLRAHPQCRMSILDKFGTGGGTDNVAELADDVRVRIIPADIRDTELVARVLHEEQIELIVHFAAETHVDRSIRNPLLFVENNVVGTASLLEAWRGSSPLSNGARARLHHVSTDEVFGSLDPDAPPSGEQAPYRPRSPYAATKAAADHLVEAYVSTYGLDAALSYSSNNFGPFQHPEKLIPRSIWCALTGRPIEIYGDGRNVRDWLFVEDHCRALEHMIRAGRAGVSYNVSTGQARENRVLIRDLCRLIDAVFAESPALKDRFRECPAARGSPCEELLTFVTDRPGHDFRYAIDSTRLSTDTGFTSSWPLDAALPSTVTWYLEHFDWLASRASAIGC